MDEEESSHIDIIEDESTLLIVDIPVLDRPHEKITLFYNPVRALLSHNLMSLRFLQKKAQFYQKLQTVQ